jgi:hypothetical protein
MTFEQILMITPQQQRAASLIDRVARTGCRLFFASTCRSANTVLKDAKIDLVLSQMILPDGTADQLLGPLEGTLADVFFANTLEDSAWWLHVLITGKNYWWKPVLVSPEQFFLYLDTRLVKEPANPLWLSPAATRWPAEPRFGLARQIGFLDPARFDLEPSKFWLTEPS